MYDNVYRMYVINNMKKKQLSLKNRLYNFSWDALYV